jgi:hypothetical protein
MLTTESTDPYVLSDEQVFEKQPIQPTYGPDQWEIERKGSRLIYDWEDASGDIEEIRFRAPAVGRSVTRELKDSYAPERQSDQRCQRSTEWTVTENITIKRVQ